MARKATKPYKTSSKEHKRLVNLLISIRDGKKRHLKTKHPAFFEAPGVLGAFFTDVFGFKLHPFRMEIVIDVYELCDPGEYSIWREEMVNLGLVVVKVMSTAKGHRTLIEPGPNIQAIINEIVASSVQIATRQDVQEIADKQESLEERVKILEQEMAEIQAAMKKGATVYLQENPPHNDERENQVLETFKRTGLFLIESDRKSRLSQ